MPTAAPVSPTLIAAHSFPHRVAMAFPVSHTTAIGITSCTSCTSYRRRHLSQPVLVTALRCSPMKLAVDRTSMPSRCTILRHRQSLLLSRVSSSSCCSRIQEQDSDTESSTGSRGDLSCQSTGEGPAAVALIPLQQLQLGVNLQPQQQVLANNCRPKQQQQQQQQRQQQQQQLLTVVLKVVVFVNSCCFELIVQQGCTVLQLLQQVADRMGGSSTPHTLRLAYAGKVLTADTTGSQQFVLQKGIRVAHILARMEGG